MFKLQEIRCVGVKDLKVFQGTFDGIVLTKVKNYVTNYFTC